MLYNQTMQHIALMLVANLALDVLSEIEKLIHDNVIYRNITLIPGLNCRKRWKNLKDQCRKEMKKGPGESEWPHFQKLKFIHHQFLAEEEEGDEDTADEVFNSLDESMKRPKLGYTMRKKLLMNKRRTIDVDMNKLIELVQAREIIWNRQLKGHHNWYKLDECWKEVSQQLEVTREFLLYVY